MIQNGAAQMSKILKVTMHVLGGVAVAAVLFAMLAAPGFLSDPSSTVSLANVLEVTRR